MAIGFGRGFSCPPPFTLRTAPHVWMGMCAFFLLPVALLHLLLAAIACRVLSPQAVSNLPCPAYCLPTGPAGASRSAPAQPDDAIWRFPHDCRPSMLPVLFCHSRFPAACNAGDPAILHALEKMNPPPPILPYSIPPATALPSHQSAPSPPVRRPTAHNRRSKLPDPRALQSGARRCLHTVRTKTPNPAPRPIDGYLRPGLARLAASDKPLLACPHRRSCSNSTAAQSPHQSQHSRALPSSPFPARRRKGGRRWCGTCPAQTRGDSSIANPTPCHPEPGA